MAIAETKTIDTRKRLIGSSTEGKNWIEQSIQETSGLNITKKDGNKKMLFPHPAEDTESAQRQQERNRDPVMNVTIRCGREKPDALLLSIHSERVKKYFYRNIFAVNLDGF